MDFRALRYFAVVVESGSLLAAATTLHMSQPSLSVAMAKLETELGVTLLNRSSRGVSPTPAGRYLVEASSRLLGDAEEMVNSLKIFAEGSAGPLGLAVVPALSWHAITDVISRMKADLPAVDVTLSSPSPWRAMEMLREGTADIAAILVDDLRRFSSRHSKEFDIFDWGRVPIVAALPRNDVADESPLKLTDFNETTLVIPRRMAAVPSLPEAVDAAFYRQNIVPSKMRTTETFNEALTLVEAGIAVSLVPDAGGKSLSRFNVTTKTVSPEIPPLAALILTRRGDQNRNSVRTFLHASGV